MNTVESIMFRKLLPVILLLGLARPCFASLPQGALRTSDTQNSIPRPTVLNTDPAAGKALPEATPPMDPGAFRADPGLASKTVEPSRRAGVSRTDGRESDRLRKREPAAPRSAPHSQKAAPKIDDLPLEEQILLLKKRGEEVPRELREAWRASPDPPGPGRNRQGGETFEEATVIDALPYNDSGTTVGYADDYQCDFDTSPDVVYSYVAPMDTMIRADLCGSFYDTRLHIWELNDADPPWLMDCNDDYCGLQSGLDYIPIVEGNTYYIVVDGFSTNEGDYVITVEFQEPPAGNNDWQTAIEIEELPYSHSGTTNGLSNALGPYQEPAEWICPWQGWMFSVSGQAADAWYHLELAEETVIQVDLCESSYDTATGIFVDTGEQPQLTDLATGNDDECGLQSMVYCSLPAGSYWIVVDGYGSSTGEYTLEVDEFVCDPLDCSGTPEEEPNNGPEEFGGDGTLGSMECGETVCGTVWADGGLRDMDWFEFSTDTTAVITAYVEVELFDPILWLYDAAYNWVGLADNNAVCEGEELLTECLLPGTYYVYVSHSDFEGVPDEQAYALTIECSPCEHACVEYGAAITEIVLPHDGTGSTLGAPDILGSTAGEVGFDFHVDTDGEYYFSACQEGTDYDVDMYIFDGNPCEGALQIAYNDGPFDCPVVSWASDFSHVLGAGDYHLVVSGWSANEGTFRLIAELQSACEPIECDGIPEEEPNNGPPEFGGDGTFDDIDCEDTICGGLLADGVTWDMDWFEIVLLEDGVLTASCEPELLNPQLSLFSGNFNQLESVDQAGWCSEEVLVSDCVPAGTYYLRVNHFSSTGVPDEQGYALSLSCEVAECPDPCEEAIEVSCWENDLFGSNVGAPNIVGNPAGDVIYNFEVPESSTVNVHLCSSSTNYDTYLRLFDTCPADPEAVQLYYDDDGPWDYCDLDSAPYEPSWLEDLDLAAGLYWLVVEGYSSSEGDYGLTISCGDDPCVGLEPVECDGTPESEPNEGWNADPPNDNYGYIGCGDTICGSVWAEGGERDMDWFRLDHWGGEIEIDTEIEEFNCVLMVTEYDPEGSVIGSSDSAPTCVPENLSLDLDPGTYFVVIAHNDFEGVPEEQDYALILTCLGDPCEGHEPVQCEGTPEEEPNEGWNADPPNASYGEIASGETVCGTAWADDGQRDMDWFRFTTQGILDVEVQAEVDEFDAILFITDFDPEGEVLGAVDSWPTCHAESMTLECLEPGEYFLVIGHNDFNGVPLEQNYSLTMNLAACGEAGPCDDLVEAGELVDVYYAERPAPSASHHDGAGCPGEISSLGLDEVFLLVLVQETDIRITHQGEANADEVILLMGDCAHPETTCGAAADEHGPGEELPAGDYYIVADYWAPGETAAYELTVEDLNSGVAENRPLQFELSHNHPNPFNPVTTIRWAQPALSRAELVIHNVLGEQVERIDLGIRGAGRHSVSWDASRHASGVYLYTLRTDQSAATRKALLIK